MTIDLDDIKVKKSDEHTNQVQVDDTITMVMKYPFDQFIKSNFDFKDRAMDQSFELIASCKVNLFVLKKKYGQQQIAQRKVTEFLESMNSSQFKGIEAFFETMPKLSHTISVTNPNTKVKSEVVLEGLSSFS